MIGADGPESDAEVIELALAALDAVGTKGYVLMLGNAGLYHDLVRHLGLPERAARFLFRNLPLLCEGEEGLEKVKEEARRLHLVQDTPATTSSPVVLDEETHRTVLTHFLLNTPHGVIGQRTLEEIESRLLKKLQGARPEHTARALEIAHRLAMVNGQAEDALTRAKSVLEDCGMPLDALSRVEQVLEVLSRKGVSSAPLTLDFGLAPGLAYYTGFVFEVRHPDTSHVLGGGGRYDGLVRELGHADDVPALGFAIGLEALLALKTGDNGEAA
jgi:ATP phosphoribosyltransferase regulatory subunit